MTASLNIEVDRRENVLRAPAAATRFKPSADVLAALKAGETKTKPNTIWTYVDGRPSAAQVTLGASDGTWTEIIDAPFGEGTPLITRVTTGNEPAAPTSRSTSPLMGTAPPARGR